MLLLLWLLVLGFVALKRTALTWLGINVTAFGFGAFVLGRAPLGLLSAGTTGLGAATGDSLLAVSASSAALAALLLLGPRWIFRSWVLAWAESNRASRRDEVERDGDPLLPSQLATVARIEAQIHSNAGLHGAVIPVRGEWGSGKSTVVGAIARRAPLEEDGADGDPRCACVVEVLAWRHQAAPSLDGAIFARIVHTPDVVRLAWLQIPVFKLLWRTAVPYGLKFRFLGLGAEVDPNTANPLAWDRELEAIGALLGRKGHRLVVVLDEVDRCEPIAAQRFVTLVARFLHRPNIVTIFPYVPHQLAFKVFNPINAVLPELRSTLQAVLWERANRADLAEGFRFDLRKETSGAGPEAKGPSTETSWSAGGGVSSTDRVDRFLDEYFVQIAAGSSEEAVLQDLFEAKLLGRNPILMAPLSARDVEDLVSGAALPSLDEYELTPPQRLALARFARERWEAEAAEHGRLASPFSRSIRQFLGKVNTTLQEFWTLGSPPEAPAERANLAAFALGIAVHLVVTGGVTPYSPTPDSEARDGES